MKLSPLVLFLFLPVNILSAQSITWMENQKIAQVPAGRLQLVHNYGDFVASYENNRYYVFEYNGTLMFSASFDGGKKWEDAKKLHSGRNLSKPTIATQTDGTICVIWQERINGLGNVRTMFSSDKAKTWSKPVTISRGGSNDAGCIVAGENNKLYAMWHSVVGKTAHEFFSVYSEGKWSEPVQLDNSDPKAMWGSITTRSKIVYAVWMEDKGRQVKGMITRSLDEGISWEKPRQYTTAERAEAPTVAATSDGHVIISFQEGQEIKVVLSSDYGKTFSEPKIVSPQGKFPRIVCNDTGFFGIAFERIIDPSISWRTGSNRQTGFVYSFNYGAAFEKDIPITRQGGDGYGSATMTRPNEISVCWTTRGDDLSSLHIKRGFLKDRI